jgi:molecular chaperone IbpA
MELADHVRFERAKLENGLLVIDLKKEIPEEMKPRRIEINASAAKKPAKKIESEVAA